MDLMKSILATVYVFLHLYYVNAGCTNFTLQPSDNLTAEYGFPVEFQWRACTCKHTINVLVSGVGVARRFQEIDSRLYDYTVECDSETNEYVATLWMVANHQTLEKVKYVSCNITAHQHTISSDRVYITDVTYPNDQLCTTSSADIRLPDASPGCPGPPTAAHFNGCVQENISMTLLFACLFVSVRLFL